MKLTTNYNLVKPELTDSPPDITAMNPNWDAIDTELKSHDDKLKNLSAYAVANGTNSYTATIAGITALTEGMTVKIKFANANTGASTLNINSLGAKAIVKSNGSALSSGNIKAGQICNLAYTGSNFQLLGEGGEYGTATALEVLSGKTIGTEEGLVTGTMPNRGAVNQNLTTEGQEYTIPAGYHNGLGKIKAVITGLVASVIKAGATVGGIAGSFTNDATATAAQMLSGVIAYVKGNKITGTIPSKGAQTYTPGTTNQTIAAGQYLSGVQTIAGSANLIPENIKDGVNIFGKIGALVDFTPTAVAGTELSVIDTVRANNMYSDYKKIKEVRVMVTGKVSTRFKQGVSQNGSSQASKMRIYVNGVARGSEYNWTNESSTVYREENIDVKKGDLVQLYARTEPAATGYALGAYTEYFRVSCVPTVPPLIEVAQSWSYNNR